MLIPEKLKKGDTIGILAACGDIKDSRKIDTAKKLFESAGYKVMLSDTIYTKKDYLCADDNTRAHELNKFFADKTIKAIIAARGGYGALRILDKIDYGLIKNNPKIFAGYSDVTALSLMIYKNTGLVTYNAPMAYSDFGSDIDEYTKQSFFNVLENGISEITVDTPKVFSGGAASGVLWGGNLSTIQSLCGLDFIPDNKFIFVTEDVNEPVYKIDRMFTQLLNIKHFKQNIAAVILGDFNGIDNEQSFNMFFKELSEELKIPVISGLKFGHEKQKQTFPIGVNVLLDTNQGKIFLQ